MYRSVLLFLAFPFAVVCCVQKDIVIVTPINTYTKEDILNKTRAYCRKYGMLPAEVQKDAEAWKRLSDEVIREFVYADLAVLNQDEINRMDAPVVSEEDIRSKYNMLLFSQKEYFTEKPDIVTAAIKYPRDTILYYPEGLKWVNLCVLPFESEIRGRAAILLNENNTTEYEKLVMEAEKDMAPRLQEFRQKLQRGMAFDRLAKEYGSIIEEDLLYEKDTMLFPSQFAAVRSLKQIGQMAEYNIYKGHVFMVFVRKPDYIEAPYETVRSELEKNIRDARIIIQHDRQMKKLYNEAVANGSVKIRTNVLK